MEGKGLWNLGKEGHCLLGRLEGASWVWGPWASPPLSPSVAQLLEACPCWWEDTVTSGWIFPWVGLSRRQTHDLIIAEMLIHPLPSPLLPPCLPWDLEMLTVSLYFNHFSQKGKKKNPQKASGQAEEMSLLSLEMVIAILKGLREHSERSAGSQQKFPLPRGGTRCPENSRESGSLLLRKCFPQPVTAPFSLSKNYH